jgi:hypothetical protein
MSDLLVSKLFNLLPDRFMLRGDFGLACRRRLRPGLLKLETLEKKQGRSLGQGV